MKVTDALVYQRDVWQRTVLFWDTLRQRANNMLEHERAGFPPLLDFKSETLLDARGFERPVNYALLRITEIGDDCWDDRDVKALRFNYPRCTGDLIVRWQ